jgi:NAD(P)-dependent dehydrogenase (short-subunit alcohol dehydrogenase family)
MAVLPLALVTGAARRLGRAFALCLARRGYALLLHYNTSRAEAEATAHAIEACNVPVYLAQANLTDASSLSSLVSLASSLPHSLHVLVNSAAIMPAADLRTTSLSDWDSVFDLNLRAPFLLTQKIADSMAENGLIVNITDVGAHKLWTNYAAYVISKSALEVLTRLQARTYAPRLRVNAIAPGLVLPADSLPQTTWEQLIQRLPLRHPVALEEMTAALEFLLDTPSITGQTITVDGGYALI